MHCGLVHDTVPSKGFFAINTQLATMYATNRKNALAWLLYIGCIEFVDNENDKIKPNIVRLFYLDSLTTDWKQEMKRTMERKKKWRKISNEKVNNSFSFWFRVLISLALKIVVFIAHELLLRKNVLPTRAPCNNISNVNNIWLWFTHFFLLLVFLLLLFCSFFFYHIPVWI